MENLYYMLEDKKILFGIKQNGKTHVEIDYYEDITLLYFDEVIRCFKNVLDAFKIFISICKERELYVSDCQSIAVYTNYNDNFIHLSKDCCGKPSSEYDVSIVILDNERYSEIRCPKCYRLNSPIKFFAR